MLNVYLVVCVKSVALQKIKIKEDMLQNIICYLV